MNRAKDIKPPYFAEIILYRCLPEVEREGLIGDFGEIYKSLIEKEKRLRAMSWYWLQVLKFLPSFIKHTLQRSNSMFKSYAKLAIRHMMKAKANTFINIFGLAIGFACCLAVMLFIQNENSYDAFHQDQDLKYRLTYDVKNGDTIIKFAGSSFPLAAAARETFPEITHSVRLNKADPQLVQKDNIRYYEHKIFYSDPEFFDLFSYKLQQGDPNTALAEHNSVILTSEMAKKYFGNDDGLNQTLTLNNSVNLKVTGVINTEGLRSHLDFDFLVSFDVFEGQRGDEIRQWNWIGAYTYIQVYENVYTKELENKIKELMAASFLSAQTGRVTPSLQPLRDVYLYSDHSYDIGIKGSPFFSNVLLIVAGMVLLIACFNFVNLSTARAIKRSREVGMRKVTGAKKGQLVGQFLLESCLLSVLGLLLAFFVVEGFFYFSQSFTGDIFALRNYSSLAGAFIGIAIVVGLVSGLYPALVLSAFTPIDTLKGSLKSSTIGKLTRKALVVSQFSISIALIIGTLILFDQVEYIKNRDIGFEKDRVIKIRLEVSSFTKNFDGVRRALSQNPNIAAVGASSHGFDGLTTSAPFHSEGINPETGFRISTMDVRHGFMEALRLEMKEGRYFSEEFPSDDSLAVIINETAAKELDWESAIGKELRSSVTLEWGPGRRVIGVVKDFNFQPLHERIGPVLLYIASYGVTNMYIRLRPGNLSEMLQSVESDWKRIVPDFPFDYSFLDEQIDANYIKEERFATSASWTSILAILIACLGLVGLVSYSLEQKMKEISIRKVIGATAPNILSLLTKDFLKLILISNIVAWPIAYYAMSRWLEDFAYRVTISSGAFLVASLAAAAIAIIAIVFQSLKVVFANPVESLRIE